ncbi:hypothetical protein PPACK8108_LOCUS20132 [Phakopsora pachyrhizi]|uniref:Uncharacterized protein n=1 Tax=Phakopsora pachyrhizi TaxID=170000 RepID=A0AAV0BGV6_PHAPC|nr:hypothetical protein PPACK8108_LOCUS20132 [Phakopsora pachyrhizi]
MEFFPINTIINWKQEGSEGQAARAVACPLMSGQSVSAVSLPSCDLLRSQTLNFFWNCNTLQNHFHQELNSDGYLNDDDNDEELVLNKGQDLVEDGYRDEAECQSSQEEATDGNDDVEFCEAKPMPWPDLLLASSSLCSQSKRYVAFALPHKMDVLPTFEALCSNNPLNLPSLEPSRCSQQQWQSWFITEHNEKQQGDNSNEDEEEEEEEHNDAKDNPLERNQKAISGLNGNDNTIINPPAGTFKNLDEFVDKIVHVLIAINMIQAHSKCQDIPSTSGSSTRPKRKGKASSSSIDNVSTKTLQLVYKEIGLEQP